MRTCADLDSYDTRILQQLSADGRTTWRDLAEIIGLSLTPTIRRVRQLEEDGFITGYFARLDERLLSGGMSVFVSITLEKQVRASLDDFEASISALPEVMSGFLMSGGADYLLRCVVRDLDQYRDRSEEHTSELQSLMRISYAVFCLKKKNTEEKTSAHR